MELACRSTKKPASDEEKLFLDKATNRKNSCWNVILNGLLNYSIPFGVRLL